MNIYFALQNPSFVEKYNQINQLITNRAQEVLALEYPHYNPELYDPTHDPLPENIYHILASITFFGTEGVMMLFGIWIQGRFAADVVNHYEIGEAPYVGDRELYRLAGGELPTTRGWLNFIYTAYGDGDTYSSCGMLKVYLEREIINRISKNYPPLEIERVLKGDGLLKGLPGYNLIVAADLIEKARAMLFLGEHWEALGAETQDRDAGEDWHWLYCKRLGSPLEPSRRYTSIAEWEKLRGDEKSQSPHYVYVYGYPNLIVVKMVYFLDEDPITISQQLDQNIVEVKMNTRRQYAVTALPIIDKLRDAGLFIVVDDGLPVKPAFDYYDFIQGTYD